MAIENHGKFSECTFGDDRCKQLLYKPEYRTQVLHHGSVTGLNKVLFVVAGENKIHYATLVHIPKVKCDLYIGILDRVYNANLKWAWDALKSNNPMSMIPDFRPSVVSSKSYPVDKDSMCHALFLWIKLMDMVEKAQLPLPLAKKIVPTIVAWWNRCKGRIDEMTRHLDEMGFIFRRGTIKQMLIMRELKKMVTTVYFVQKHCFPKTAIPVGKGYTAIQGTQWSWKRSMRDVLHELASWYKPYDSTGAAPSADSPTKEVIEDGDIEMDDVDQQLSKAAQDERQKEAAAYCKEKVPSNSRFKLKKFAGDAELNKIRRSSLDHLPRSRGCYEDAKTGRSTSSKKMAKKRKRDAAGGAGGVDKKIDAGKKKKQKKKESESTAKKQKKKESESTAKRNTIPFCILCLEQVGWRRAPKSVWYCPTCNVHLCNEVKANRKFSCFKRFHNATTLDTLLKKEALPPRTSPRRQEKNRRSPRKRGKSAEEDV